MIFFHEKDSRFNSLIIHKRVFFLVRQVPIKIWVENSVFAIQLIGNRKSFTEVLSLRDQTNPFAYSCCFTFHTSYENGIIGQAGRGGGGRRYQNAQKQLFIKTY